MARMGRLGDLQEAAGETEAEVDQVVLEGLAGGPVEAFAEVAGREVGAGRDVGQRQGLPEVVVEEDQPGRTRR